MAAVGTSTTRTTTTHDNVLATRAYSAWLLDAVPMPPTAQRWRHSPNAHFRHGSLGIGPSDVAFTRTTWWTVKLSSAALTSWLRAHTPSGLAADSDSGGSVQSTGVWEHDLDFRGPSTSAHTDGWVNFAFTADGDHLAVRVDTFVGARFARTALVPPDARTVTIRRTEKLPRPRARAHVTVRTVTDRRAVATLVGLVNGRPGAMTSQFVASCPAVTTQLSYEIVFTTPQGRYAASLPTVSCWPELTLTHDGATAGPPLDPGQHFATVVDSYLR